MIGEPDMVFLDTSVVIDLLYGVEDVVERIKSYEGRGEEISITTITEYELLRHPNEIKRELAESAMSKFAIKGFDRSSAKEAARIYLDLRKKGKQINENDILVAAIAFSNNEYLLASDKKFRYLGQDRLEIL